MVTIEIPCSKCIEIFDKIQIEYEMFNDKKTTKEDYLLTHNSVNWEKYTNDINEAWQKMGIYKSISYHFSSNKNHINEDYYISVKITGTEKDIVHFKLKYM